MPRKNHPNGWLCSDVRSEKPD